jgi:murein DD-endopeptidase MepM/ murein hydrolase activator NlpD
MTQSTSTFADGQQVFAAAVVNIRRSPGYRNKPGNDVLGRVADRTPVTVLGSLVEADGLTWWPVRTVLENGQTVEGWMAEATADGSRLLSADTPPAQSGSGQGGNLAAGEAVAIVTPEPVNVRRTPGYVNKPQEDIVAAVSRAATLTIVQGPQQADGLIWWQVSGTTAGGQDVAGWMAQVAPDGTRLIVSAQLSESIRVGKPFQGQFAVTQWWGSHPGFYSQFTYSGVSLKGHNGIDFGLPVGTPLVAVDAGQVKKAGFEKGGFGHYVLLQHAWGESIYAHQERVDVSKGQSVGAGEVIGSSGNTGASTGPHLHFGIRINPYRRADGWGGFSNPAPLMDRADLIAPRAAGTAPTPMGEEVLEDPRP